MYLGNFIKNINSKYYKIIFSGLAFNSKQVKKNNIFFALKGNKLNGNKYVSDAINRGAKIIVSDENLKINKKDIIFIKHNKPRKLLAEISYKYTSFFQEYVIISPRWVGGKLSTT